MGRVEENKGLLQFIAEHTGKETSIGEAEVMNLNFIVSALADISVSLAVIADCMQQGEKDEAES